MTIEEKAKAYDKALNKARKHYNDKYHPDMGPGGVYLNNADLEEMFPQLKESKYDLDFGEWIAVIEDLKLSDDQRKKFLDKLKKQKEQKPIENPFDANETMKMKDGIDDGFTKFMEKEQKPVEIHIDNPNIQKVDPNIKIITSDSSASGDELLYVSNKSYAIDYRDGKKEAEQKPTEIDEYEIIKKHITEGSLSSEVNKRLTECGWYVTEQKPEELNVEDYRLRDTWEYIDEFIKKFGRVPKDIDELSACVDYVIKHKTINDEKQKPVQYIPYTPDSVWQKIKSAITDCKNLSEHYEDTEENFHQYYGGKAEGLQLALGYLGDENELPLKEQKPSEQNIREQIVSKATTERQVVLISKSNNRAEINWDTRSLEDTKDLLECGLTFINKQLGIKSSEWGEKDKEMLTKIEQIVLKHWNSLSDSFYHKHDDENEDAESCYNWIKYLPDRFNLESKRERGEEACPNEAKQECSSIDISGSIKTSHIKTLENLLSYLKYERKTTQTEINTSFIPCLENLLKDAENTNGHVECIKFDNEFENQVSYLLASVLNGEHEYSNGFIKYAAQSLLGQAKNELNLTTWSNVTINGKPIPTENQSVDISLANWSDEDLQYKNWILACLADRERKMPGYADDFRVAYNWLKSLPERFVLQSKHEWSNEDSTKIGTLSSIIYDYAFYKDALDENNDLTGEYAELDNWLGSLPERFNLKPKKHIEFTEKQDYSGLNDLERAIHRGFLVVGVENVPVTIIKETAQDCLAQVKPLEWIEEDLWIIKAIENAIKVYGKTQGRYIAGYDMDTLIAHLKNAFTCLEYNKTLFNSGNGLYYYIDGKAIYVGDPATMNNPYDFAMSQQENTNHIENEK